jgi:cell volume regulation protein A
MWMLLVDAATLAFLLTGIILSVGALSSYLFRRTGIPELLFLITLGAIFGPLLGLIEPSSVLPLAPYLATLALIVILFEGGLNLDLRRTILESPRAVVLAVLGFLLAVGFTALFSMYALNLRLLYGLLLGSIVGGSSSIVILSLAPRIGVSERCSTILSIESAITDILCTVGALTVLGIIVSGLPPIEHVARTVTGEFSTGAMLGAIVGFLWLNILLRIRGEPYAYMFTLGVAFMLYFSSESLGGSGAFSILVFGLILGNDVHILRFLYKAEMFVVDEGMRRFEAEIAFLIRTFFFLYLGLMIAFESALSIFLGIALSLLLLAARWIAVNTVTLRSALKFERRIMTTLLSRGLAAAVLATLPVQLGLPHANLMLSIAIVVILSTAVIGTVGVAFSPRSRPVGYQRPP